MGLMIMKVSSTNLFHSDGGSGDVLISKSSIFATIGLIGELAVLLSAHRICLDVKYVCIGIILVGLDAWVTLVFSCRSLGFKSLLLMAIAGFTGMVNSPPLI